MSSASVQLARAPQKYAVLYLPELVTGNPSRDRLFTPLTLAYLLSMHVPFCVPVNENTLATVESIFDQVLNGHSLRSKGILYEYIDHPGKLDRLISESVLVISTDMAGSSSLDPVPHALVCSTPAGYAVRLHNVHKLNNEDLKGELVGCCQLINIQSGGFITEGHLSLFSRKKECRGFSEGNRAV